MSNYFSVLLDGVEIYDPTNKAKTLINPQLSLAVGEAGSFTFTIDPEHTAYNSIIPYGSNIEVFEDGVSVFFGRPLPPSVNFYNQKTYRCEGALAFLNDIILPPMTDFVPVETSGTTGDTFTSGTTGDTFSSGDTAGADDDGYVRRSINLRTYLQYVFSEFNAKQLTRLDRRLILRNENIADMTLYYNSDFKSCLEILRTEIMPHVDGYLVAVRSNGTTYVDIVKSYQTIPNQQIRAGVNLLDFAAEQQPFYTGVVAKGGEASNQFVSGDYIHWSQEASGEIVARYGLMYAYKNWPECKTTDALAAKCTEFLSEQQFSKMRISADAIDLHIVDGNYDAIKLGRTVTFNSPVHMGSTVDLVVSGIRTNLATGEKYITLGEREKGNAPELSTIVIDASVKSKERLIDYAPTEGSPYPVTSDGVYQALQGGGGGGGGGGITVDPVPTSGSTNPVSSGGVYDALQNLGDGWTHQIDGVTQTTGTINFVTTP